MLRYGIDRRLSKFAWFLVNHWLAILITLTALFMLPVFGVPLLMASDVPVLQSLGDIVFGFYGAPVCHQLPQRSLYLFGYQMAVCARDVGIYGSFLAGCILFAFVHKRMKIWSLKWYVVLCIPIAIDGFAQLFGVSLPRGIGPGWQLIWTAESTNLFRIVTGSVFGLASAMYVLPYLEAIFTPEPVFEPPVKRQQPRE